MKRAILAIVGTAAGLVLLLSFKTHPASSSNTAAGTGTGAGGDTAAPAPSASESAGTGSGSKKSSGSTTRTVTGDTIDTRWGPVQVRVTLTSGKITKVETVQVPDGNPRDQEINSFAVPQLKQETLAAQSAQIDT